MDEQRPRPTALPVGFEAFSRQVFLNYQLNRAHALGYADRGELHRAAGSIRSLADCIGVFEQLSSAAEHEGRLRAATSYLRLVEFFTPPRRQDKASVHRRYRELFDRAFADTGVARFDVDYGSSSLPAYRLPAMADTARGTVLVHGGFDSLIEEFFAVWERISAAGFDVIAFEGPGQGGARALGGLTFEHDWEKPVGAVLDHFAVSRASLVGLSMGGYWAIRAAGREPRIERVVSWPPVYDWLHRLPATLRGPVRAMVHRRRFMNAGIRLRMRLFPVLRHVVNHTLYLVDGDEPMQAVDWLMAMNAGHLGSDRVAQDVLVLYGEGDTFQPPVLARRQVEALTSARSVVVRGFTAAEHADRHCQMGNLDLACQVVTGWLQDMST